MARHASRARKVLTFASDADNEVLARVTGALDANLRQIETELDVAISRRGHQFRIEGAQDSAQAGIDVLQHFLARAGRSRRPLSVDDIQLYFVEQRGQRKPSAQGDEGASGDTLPQLSPAMIESCGPGTSTG